MNHFILNMFKTLFYFALGISLLQFASAKEPREDDRGTVTEEEFILYEAEKSAEKCLKRVKCVEDSSQELLKLIRIRELKRLHLFNGKKVKPTEIKSIDLRVDQSIDSVQLQDNTVVDRTDILSAETKQKTGLTGKAPREKDKAPREEEKSPREEDRVSPEQLRIHLPSSLKEELELGVDGGGMTLPEELLNEKLKLGVDGGGKALDQTQGK